jgi:hypothetical protein
MQARTYIHFMLYLLDVNSMLLDILKYNFNIIQMYVRTFKASKNLEIFEQLTLLALNF